MLIRLMPLVIALAVILSSGLIQGLWSSRWSAAPELEPAVAALRNVPLTVGEWQGRNVVEDEEAFTQAGALGHWTRVYQGKDGAFTVILMAGPTRRMAVHTPDVCYRGVGFEMMGVPAKISAGNGAEFWTAIFRKEDASAITRLRISWTWKCEGAWQAPDQARWTFRGVPFLYKLYVVQEIHGDDSQEANEDFLRALVAALDQTLYAPRQHAALGRWQDRGFVLRGDVGL